MRIRLDKMKRVTNEAFWPLYRDESRVLILYGGAGAGKSEFAASKAILRMIREPGSRGLLLRKTKTSIRRSSYELIKTIILRRGWGDAFSFRDPICEIKCVNGSEIISAGLDDAEKLKSITEVDWVWIEEATEIDEDTFDQIDLRLRSPKYYNQIILTFNPISAMHWIKARWIPDEGVAEGEIVASQSDADARILKTTYLNNRFIAPGYGERIEKMRLTNPGYYKIYVLAEWGDLRGLIYGNWAVCEPPEKVIETFYGLDFGFSHPAALTRILRCDEGFWLDEAVYKSGLDAAELAAAIEAASVSKSDYIYADPEDPGSISALRKRGYNIRPAKKEAGSVFAGISFLQSLPIHVTPHSVNLIAEGKTYHWKTDPNGKPMDVPEKENDHGMDGARYAIYERIGRSRDLMATKRNFGV